MSHELTALALDAAEETVQAQRLSSVDGIFLIPFPTGFGKNSGKDIRALERTTGWQCVTSDAPDIIRKPPAVAPGLGGSTKREQYLNMKDKSFSESILPPFYVFSKRSFIG